MNSDGANFLMGLILVLGMVILLGTCEKANSHEIRLADGESFQYPKGCCSNKDCRPLTRQEAQFTADGWQIGKTERRFKSLQEFRPSPDRRWHACFYEHGFLAGHVRWSNKKPCVWSPEAEL